MAGGNEWPPWLLGVFSLFPGVGMVGGLKAWEAFRQWRGDLTSAQVAQENVELAERVQLAAERSAVAARADAAFARSDAEVARLADVHVRLRADLATETVSGRHWYDVARAWSARAWDKLLMARSMREDVIEAREGWADDRRGWFLVDPEGAGRARRPEWMGPPPGFVIVEPKPIPDPPGLEDILK